MKLDPYQKSITNSKWIISLNINTTIITLLGESIGVNLYDTGSAMVSVTIKCVISNNKN